MSLRSQEPEQSVHKSESEIVTVGRCSYDHQFLLVVSGHDEVQELYTYDEVSFTFGIVEQGFND